MNTFEHFWNDKESRLPDGTDCYKFVQKHKAFTHLHKYITDNWTDTYFVETTPGSIGCLPQLLEHFPNANYLFLERHPLKIVLSLLNMRRKGEDYEALMGKRKIFHGKLNKNYEKMGHEEFRAIKLFGQIRRQRCINLNLQINWD